MESGKNDTKSTAAKKRGRPKKAPGEKSSRKKGGVAMPGYVPSKKKMGRPTKYSDDIPSRALEFFKAPRYDEENKVYFFPTALQLADHLGVALQTIYTWAEEHPEFAAALAEGKQRSLELRVAWAQSERINPAFSKFVLASRYDMVEGQNVNIGQSDGKPFEFVIKVVSDNVDEC